MTPMMVRCLALAEVRLEAQLADALQDVVDLLVGGVGAENDNHGVRGVRVKNLNGGHVPF